MSRVVAIAIALLALLLLMWLAVSREGPGIESDLYNRVTHQLAQADLSNVAVLLDGQEVYLEGSVVSTSQRNQALLLAREQWGVSTVHDSLQVISTSSAETGPSGPQTKPLPEQTAQPPTSQAIENNGTARDLRARAGDAVDDVAAVDRLLPEISVHLVDKLAVYGIVADPATREAVADAVFAQFPNKQQDNKLTVDGRVASADNADLLKAVRFALPQLGLLSTGLLLVRDGVIDISGEAADFSSKARLLSAVTSLDGNLFRVQVAIDAPAATELGCQALFDEMLQLETVKFATNSADIDPISLPLLRRLASVMNSCGFEIEIGGHTDATGDEVYNQWLSERRAEAVKEFLVAQGESAAGASKLQRVTGTAASALVSAVGYGETKPIDSNATRSGRATNRRIEFRIRRPSP